MVSTKARRRKTLGALAMLSPALVLAVVFFMAPIVLVIGQSFTNTPLIGSGRFVGLDNYTKLLSDSGFMASMRFGLMFTLLASVITVFGAYALGILVRGTRRFVGVFRGLYLLPFVVGLSTLSYIALLEFRPGYGSVNQFLSAVGLTDGQTAWLITPELAVWSATLVTAWGAVGFGMVLFMASMQSVPTELLEAARVDGTSWLQRERYVVLPMVRHTLALVSITTVAGNFLAFTQFYILTQGGPGTSTATPVILAYKTAISQFRLGYASAMSVVLLLLIALLTSIQFYLFKARADD